MPSLDDWEKQWKKNPHVIAKPAVVQVDFKALVAAELGALDAEDKGVVGRVMV